MHVQANAALISHNTLALAAQCSALATVGDAEGELVAALTWAKENGLPVLPLGEGSNVVLAGNVEAMVLRLQNRGIEVLNESAVAVELRVAAGENWHEFVTWSLQQGYCGLENLALIPGTVGAAPIQNIGAYGVELCSYISRVHARDCTTAQELQFTRDECAFAYRDSIFKNALRDTLVITAVDFTLPRSAAPHTSYPALSHALELLPGGGGDSLTPQAVFETVVALRQSKLPDPKREPNAGSFFKNPVLSEQQFVELSQANADVPSYPQADGQIKIPAAWLIEQCGWKAHRRLDQGVHAQHALVLVNYGNSSGADLLALASDIQADVNKRFSIALEIEPRVYGKPNE